MGTHLSRIHSDVVSAQRAQSYRAAVRRRTERDQLLDPAGSTPDEAQDPVCFASCRAGKDIF